jgi:hypothetical protein
MKSKDQKRMEAETRNAAWNKLTPLQKAKELLHRPGLCKKQLTKLDKEHAA